jgi:hypothetical protein
VACEVEAVDEADEPPLLVEWPGPELSEALTGESDETSDTEDCLVPDAVFSTSEPTGSRAVSYSRPDSPAIRDSTMWDASRSTFAKVS